MVYSPGQVLTLERSNYQTLPSGYGGGSDTLRVLQYLRGRFGHVASFSGSYHADSWTLQISRQNVSGVFLLSCVANHIMIANTVMVFLLYSLYYTSDRDRYVTADIYTAIKLGLIQLFYTCIYRHIFRRQYLQCCSVWCSCWRSGCCFDAGTCNHISNCNICCC